MDGERPYGPLAGGLMIRFLEIYLFTLAPILITYYVVFPLIRRALERRYVHKEPLPPLSARSVRSTHLE